MGWLTQDDWDHWHLLTALSRFLRNLHDAAALAEAYRRGCERGYDAGWVCRGWVSDTLGAVPLDTP